MILRNPISVGNIAKIKFDQKVVICLDFGQLLWACNCIRRVRKNLLCKIKINVSHQLASNEI